MSNNRLSEQDALRSALGPGTDCPPLEDLERLVSQQPPAPNVAKHLQSCSYCQTELQMLHAFQAGEAGPANREVERVSELLQARSQKIVRQAGLASTPAPWWKTAFTLRRLAQTSFATAAILLVAGIALQFRPTRERPLNETTPSGQEVLRSGGFAVLSPVGDLQQQPAEIRWEKVPKAASYRVRILEVDRSELWKAETSDEHIDLPPAIRSRIVPAKTLFCEVTAWDASGSKIAETGLVRFRLFLNSINR
jgi:hypothetical protein